MVDDVDNIQTRDHLHEYLYFLDDLDAKVMNSANQFYAPDQALLGSYAQTQNTFARTTFQNPFQDQPFAGAYDAYDCFETGFPNFFYQQYCDPLRYYGGYYTQPPMNTTGQLVFPQAFGNDDRIYNINYYTTGAFVF